LLQAFAGSSVIGLCKIMKVTDEGTSAETESGASESKNFPGLCNLTSLKMKP